MGYDIPKGSTIVPNHWSLDLDEEIFEDPLEFRPERWLANPNLPLATFGFGKRLCPGQHIVRKSLFINISRVLWAFEISYAYENGQKQKVDPRDMEQDTPSGPTPSKRCYGFVPLIIGRL